VNEYDWMTNANCKGVDVNVFHPRVGESVKPALGLCGKCEVSKECLEFAIKFNITEGVWGGMAENPRARLARERRGLHVIR
jgi:WhiB family redox-sensing transcriptional regulator